MTVQNGQWRVRYTPGDWTVLAGPASLVVLEPAAAHQSVLVATLWREVLASASITELAWRMAGFGIDAMPTFAAFFWSDDSMRSLVRGLVSVVEVSTGRTVADGVGVQTWTEVGLAGVERVRIDLGNDHAGLELPLVVGAALASSIILDVRGVPLPTGGGAAAAATGTEKGSGNWWERGGPPLSLTAPHSADGAAAPESGNEVTNPTPGTEFYPAPHLDEGPRPGPVEPVLATLRLPDQTSVDLGQPILIGRAPTADASSGQVQLVSVVSPSGEISRTHVRVESKDSEVVVTDLQSTNGTRLILPQSRRRPQVLPPGRATTVPVGSTLDLGDGVRVVIDPPAS